MFTGVISDVGRVQARKGGRLAIACGYDKTSLNIGASIACSGCCLTITQIESIGTLSVDRCLKHLGAAPLEWSRPPRIDPVTTNDQDLRVFGGVYDTRGNRQIQTRIQHNSNWRPAR